MKIIALMSGSSLDGIDIAQVDIWEDKEKLKWNLLYFDLYPYDKTWRDRLYNLPEESSKNYVLTKAEYSMLVAKVVLDFISKNKIQADLISWHGHTIFHLPEKYVSEQIGEGGIMASITGIKTITDFRISDIALSGQGTPLAPLVEKHMFPGHTFYLNLGGIANLSIYHPNGIQAYDVAPANQLINYISQELDLPFDRNGILASSGNVNQVLLSNLNQFEYYNITPPKSLDNNWIRANYFPILKNSNISTIDKLATTTQFIVDIIFTDLVRIHKKHFNQNINSKLFVSGGGVHNTFLIDQLKMKFSTTNIDVFIPPIEIIDFKETLLMALLGYFRVNERSNVLSSVTGSTKDSIGGALYV